VAYVVFLRQHPREALPERDRRLAPPLALFVVGIVAVLFAGYWAAYFVSGTEGQHSKRVGVVHGHLSVRT
jgi:hypothetical protein